MKAVRYLEMFGPDSPVPHYVPQERNPYLCVLLQ